MTQWKDPMTIVAVAGWAVAAGSSAFAVMQHFWHRRESRHDVLSKILQPMTNGVQSLMIANNARQTRDQLIFSYPENDEPTVVRRIDELLIQFNESNSEASKEFRASQTEFASTSFRFPRSLAQSIQKAQSSLAELGRLVNSGIHHKFELELAKYRDDHGRITKLARGWELSGPLEILRRRVSTQKTIDDGSDRFEFDLTQDEMDRLLELFHRRATTQADNTFVVHPPTKLLNDSSIATSDLVIDELAESVFTVVFQDGTSVMLGLHELVAFVYQLCMVQLGVEEAISHVPEGGAKPHKIEVSLTLSMRDLMRPEMVKLMLSKVEFSKEPSDGMTSEHQAM